MRKRKLSRFAYKLGQRIGTSVVICTDPIRSARGGRLRYWMQCDCFGPHSCRSVTAEKIVLYSSGCFSCGRTQDLEGERFGRLFVLRFLGIDKSVGAMYLVRCDCGTEKPLSARVLKSHNTTSCGCYHREVVTVRNLKQHMQGTAECGFLYVVHLSSSDESFIKFGYADNVEKRMYSFQQPCQGGYDVRLVHAISGLKTSLLDLESFLHGRKTGVAVFSDFKYRPLHAFGGYTECFRTEVVVHLCEYLDNFEENSDAA
jgi:hypothetical protein